MSGVSEILIKTVLELQNLPSLKDSSLGGGTNLAIRYSHRKSIDIDLFFSGIIGKSGFESIVKEMKAFYGGNISGISFPCEEDDQYIFLRFFIHIDEDLIKVEIMQNMLMLDSPEELKVLFKDLSQKQKIFNLEIHKNIFDLDEERTPVEFPELLLKFENPAGINQSRPNHSHTRIDIMNEHKSWIQARSSWRRKVR